MVKEALSFFERKLALFERYLGLTRRMKERLNGKETCNLETFISERQDYICSIQETDSSMKRFLNASADKLSHSSEKFKILINGYVRRIRDTMEIADSIDRELMAMVRVEGENIRRELVKMRNFKQATQGYNNKAGYRARFLDAIR